MAVELGWTRAEIRQAQERPDFFEGVGRGLQARALSQRLEDLDASIVPGMTAKQRANAMKARGERSRILRLLRGD